MTENLIDREAWETMKAMTDPEFLASLIDVFLTDSPELIRQMHQGLMTGDIELVRRAAHSLKSNSASFGANRLAGAARDFEMAAKNGSLDDGESKLSIIESEYTQLLPVMMELKNER